MSNLLQVVRLKADKQAPKGRRPLILEFRVDPQTVPYLVSSSMGVLWIEEPHVGETPIVKAAVRKTPPGELFWEASKAIYNTALECRWGSAHPFTQEGLAQAIEHVSSYDMGAVDVLVGPVKKGSSRPNWLQGVGGQRVQMSAWIPENCAIIVPTDRQFVGLLVQVAPGAVAMAVHNPSRGFAMCWDGITSDVVVDTVAEVSEEAPTPRVRKKRVA